jgi:hypothetical protein
VSAEEIAGIVGTISYEITCGVSRRVPRRFKEEGDEGRMKGKGEGVRGKGEGKGEGVKGKG